jgi:hypothetical protein
MTDTNGRRGGDVSRAIEALRELQPRVAKRAGPPSEDRVAGQLAAAMDALIDTERLAAGSEEAAEHSDSHGRIRAMSQIRAELEAAAKSLDRAGERILEFYFETR